METPERKNLETEEGRTKFLYRSGRMLFRGMGRVFFRWQVFGAERMPLKGRLIIAANHQSYIDPGMIGAAAPRELHYLARENVFKIPVGGAILRAVNAIPVNQEGSPAAGLRAGLEVLERERALVLFPEGSRTWDGEIHPFRSGVGMIVVKSRAPVLPVRLFGLFDAYGRHMTVARPRPIVVKMGRVLRFDAELEEFATASKPRQREIYQGIATKIQDAILDLRPDAES